MKRIVDWHALSGVLLAILFIVGPRAARAAGLGLGDPAPPLALGAFVKGAPITALPKGRLSVVEFWATDSAPSRDPISYLTQLAKHYPQVTFLAVSIREKDPKDVATFVAAMGAKMNYPVALDRVPEGKTDDDGVMAKSWMAAAGQDKLPTAFLIGKDGKIAWIGHPLALGEPLARSVRGTWSLAAAARELHSEAVVRNDLDMLENDMQQAVQENDTKKLGVVIGKAIAKYPSLEDGPMGFLKFGVLRQTASENVALAYGKHLVEVVYRDDIDGLNNLAWSIADPAASAKPDAAFAALALTSAVRADALAKSGDAKIADTLAAAYHAHGDDTEAVQVQTRALRLAGPSGDGVAEMKAHLAIYQRVPEAK